MTVTLRTEECDKCSLLPLMCKKTVNQSPNGLAGGKCPQTGYCEAPQQRCQWPLLVSLCREGCDLPRSCGWEVSESGFVLGQPNCAHLGAPRTSCCLI